MDKIEKCHICDAESESEFYCCDCEEPVCEDRCVMPTYMNQIDYTICIECGDHRESKRTEYLQHEWELEDKLKKDKEKKAEVRRKNYFKPENVARRKEKKEALLLVEKESADKRMREDVQIIGSMFRGMF